MTDATTTAERRSDAMRALHQWALEHRDVWPHEEIFDRVVRASLASATRAFGAIRHLTDERHGPDALKLCRSMVETLIVTYWMCHIPEPDWVVERMREHRCYGAITLAEVVQKHPGWLDDFDPELPPHRDEDRERWSALYGRYAEQSWWAREVEPKTSGGWKITHTRSLRTLADDMLAVPELEERIWHKVEDGPAPSPFLSQVLDIPQSVNNSLLHHNPAGLANYVDLDHDELVFGDEPGDDWVPQAQVLAYIAFMLLVQLMVRRYRPELEESLDELDPGFVAAFRTLSEHDLAFARDSRNRNKPCPCGSGLKCKRCHGAP